MPFMAATPAFSLANSARDLTGQSLRQSDSLAESGITRVEFLFRPKHVIPKLPVSVRTDPLRKPSPGISDKGGIVGVGVAEGLRVGSGFLFFKNSAETEAIVSQSTGVFAS